MRSEILDTFNQLLFTFLPSLTIAWINPLCDWMNVSVPQRWNTIFVLFYLFFKSERNQADKNHDAMGLHFYGLTELDGPELKYQKKKKIKIVSLMVLLLSLAIVECDSDTIFTSNSMGLYDPRNDIWDWDLDLNIDWGTRRKLMEPRWIKI